MPIYAEKLVVRNEVTPICRHWLLKRIRMENKLSGSPIDDKIKEYLRALRALFMEMHMCVPLASFRQSLFPSQSVFFFQNYQIALIITAASGELDKNIGKRFCSKSITLEIRKQYVKTFLWAVAL
jgi:hypothetical protein